MLAVMLPYSLAMTDPRLHLRAFACLVLFAVLGACADPPREPRAYANRSPGDPNLIEVRIGENESLVQEVWLRGPAGEAASGLRVPNDQSATGSDPIGRPAVSLGATGGSSSGVKPYVGLGLPLFGSAPAARRGEALFLIPVPASFTRPRADSGWLIEVRYRDARHRTRSLDIPAPP